MGTSGTWAVILLLLGTFLQYFADLVKFRASRVAGESRRSHIRREWNEACRLIGWVAVASSVTVAMHVDFFEGFQAGGVSRWGTWGVTIWLVFSILGLAWLLAGQPPVNAASVSAAAPFPAKNLGLIGVLIVVGLVSINARSKSRQE